MNVQEINTTLDEANDDDLISLFVFRKPVKFCKEKYDFDISKETKTLSLISKDGKKLKVINTNSIKFIEVKSPVIRVMDPILDNKKN